MKSDFGRGVPDIDLRRLRMFVTVMEAPSLRAAADELFITQQALSSAIRELERHLGVELFSRSRRNLTATAAGEAMYRGAVTLLAGGEHLVSQVRLVDRASPNPFVIGHAPDLAPSEVFQIIEPVVREDPSAPITVRPVFAEQMRDELIAGTIDLALGRGVANPTDLAATIATQHVLRLAVQSDHPLAQHDQVEVSSLADFEIVVWGAEHETEYTDILVAICRRAGFEPRMIVSTLLGTPPHTAVIAHPKACAFVTNEPGWLYENRIRIIEFTDPPMAPVRALWLPNTASIMRQKILDSVTPEQTQRTLVEP